MMRNNHTQAAGIACFGEILLRLAAPHSELLLQTRTFVGHIGGAEANVAVALAQWGHRAWAVSVLPDNPLGHAAAGELRRFGVDTTAAQYRPGRMGLYFLTVGAGHRPSEVLYDREGSAFAMAHTGTAFAAHQLVMAALNALALTRDRAMGTSAHVPETRPIAVTGSRDGSRAAR